MTMKTSLLRPSLLPLALALAACLAPLSAHSRGVADARKDDRPKTLQKKTSGRPAGNAPLNSATARNPLTGSSVNTIRKAGSAPKKVARPTNPAAVNRPNPNAAANNQAKAKGAAINQAKAKGAGANQAKAKGPATIANRPAPKPTGNVANLNTNPPDLNKKPAPRPPGSVATLPAARPKAKPAFVPGKVTYPGQITRPAPKTKTPKSNHPAYHANRPKPRPLNQVIANSNVNSNNRVTNTNIANVGNRTSNRVTNVTNNTYVNNNWGNQWTNNRTTVWNNTRVVNNRPVVINRNFTRSVNYAYRPAAWGSRPWWSSSTYHSWHHGSWNYGWNRSWRSYHYAYRPAYYRPPGAYLPGYHVHYHDDDDLGEAVAWGIAAWSLGRLAFDSGYNTYRNPYPAPPVQTRRTVINYTLPLSVAASREEPEPEEEALTSQEKSTAAIERARGQFSSGDYLSALKSTDESISWAAGDSALHEFRALCLFALGRYGDAAGVLNPVLASGPGWDWSTMAAFYPDSDSYTDQLRKLESYVEANPNSADAHFLLGYHYMVAGFIDQAYGMFDRVVALQPADTVAAQLRNLAESSSPEAESEAPSPEDVAAAAAPDPGVTVEPVDPSDLEGGWKASSADGKAIQLSLGADGKFTWNYDGAEGTVLAGDWSIDEEGQLVLATDDVQMVADISLDGDNLKFVLDGAPVGDPGLSFQRQ